MDNIGGCNESSSGEFVNSLSLMTFATFYAGGGSYEHSSGFHQNINNLPLVSLATPYFDFSTTNSEVLFEWRYFDFDSYPQARYQIIISTSPNFIGTNYGSEVIISSAQKCTLSLPFYATYYWCVRVADEYWYEFGVSTYTSRFIIRGLNPPSLPPTPWVNIWASSVTISWTLNETPPNSDDTTYVVQLSTSENFTGVTISSQTVRTAGLVSVSSLSPNTTYYARVIAKNVFDQKISSAGARVTLCMRPAVADSASWDVYENRIVVKWRHTNPDNPPATKYIIQLSTSANFTGEIFSSVTIRGANSALIEVSRYNTLYYARVTAENLAGQTVVVQHSWMNRYSGIQVSTGINYDMIGQTSITVSGATISGSHGNAYSNLHLGNSGVFFKEVMTGRVTGWLKTNTTTYVGLYPNVSYKFWVKSRNAGINTLNDTPIETPWCDPPVATRIEEVERIEFIVCQTSIAVKAIPSGAESFFNLEVGESGIYYGVFDNENNILISTWTKNSNFYWFDSLQPNTTYYFEANSRNQFGLENTKTSLYEISTLCNPPLCSSGPFVIFYTSVTVFWDPNSNSSSTRYVVEIASDESFETIITSSLVYTNSYTDTDLLHNTTFYFRVKAINNNGIETSWVYLGKATTLNPFSPIVFWEGKTDTSITIGWQDVYSLDSPDTVYIVEVSTDINFSLVSSSIGVKSDSKLTVEGLLPNTVYYGRVVIQRGNENFYVMLDSFCCTLCSLPEGCLWSEVSTDTIKVMWDTSLSNNPYDTTYIIEVSTSLDFVGKVVSLETLYGGGSGAILGVQPNTVYYGRVVAVNRTGERIHTLISSPTVAKCTLANIPSKVEFSLVSSTQIAICWDNNDNPEYTLYVVEVSSSDEMSFVEVYSGCKTEFIHKGLLPNTTYCYRLKAVNLEGIETQYIFLTTFTITASIVENLLNEDNKDADDVIQLKASVKIPGVKYNGKYIGVKKDAPIEVEFNTIVNLERINVKVEKFNHKGGFSDIVSCKISSSVCKNSTVITLLPQGLQPANKYLLTVSVIVEPSKEIVLETVEFETLHNLADTNKIVIDLQECLEITYSNILSCEGYFIIEEVNSHPKKGQLYSRVLQNLSVLKMFTVQLYDEHNKEILFVENEFSIKFNNLVLDNKLVTVYYYDEKRDTWIKLPTKVNKTTRCVTTNSRYLGIFAIMSVQSYSLDDIKCYPVPWVPEDGLSHTGTIQEGIRFINLPPKGEILIYSVSGMLVKKIDFTEEDNGEIVWYGTDHNGREVSSGVYLWIVKVSENKKTGKLLIIR
ncbi:MAG: fibronectin type III domain-containing protein [Endomicrobia bacterium]|nr:fibronectin type III domain-containing protein [Endomicrobiia bacterium]